MRTPLTALAGTTLIATLGLTGALPSSTAPAYAAVVPADVMADNQPPADADGDTVWDAADEVALDLPATGVVTIDQAGTYRLRGTLSGEVVVDAPDALVRLILDDVSITSTTSAALDVVEAAKVVVITPDGMTSTLTDAVTYADSSEDAPGAALYSAADLVLGGAGTLRVTGRHADGIASSDGLVIRSGTYVVDAADDGIRGKDHLVVRDGDLTVTAVADGLKSTNEEKPKRGYVALLGGTATVDAGNDGVQATTDVVVDGMALTVAAVDDGVHADETLSVEGGTIDVTRSEEGLEGRVVQVTGGTTSVLATDDGVNAAADDGLGISLLVAGGTLAVSAQGDGLDSNGTLTVTGGTTVVAGPTGADNSPLDADGLLTVDGGVVLAVGSSGMLQTPASTPGQAWIAGALSASRPAGTVLSVVGPTGELLATYVASKPFQGVVYSSPTLTDGSAYRLYVGGAATGSRIGGLASGGTAGTTLVATLTAGQASGGAGGPGGTGGMPGGGSGVVPTTPATPTTPVTPSTTTPGSTSAAATTTTVRLRRSTVRSTKRAKALITVSNPSGVVPTGAVVVRVDDEVVRRVALTADANGRLTVRLPRVRARGSHRVKVVYQGTTGLARSAVTTTLTVR